MSAAWKPASTASSIALSATKRFPGADIAVEQAVHRARRWQGPRGFRAIARCCAPVSGNGSDACSRRISPSEPACGSPGCASVLRPLRSDAELHGKKLREHEVPPRFFESRHRASGKWICRSAHARGIGSSALGNRTGTSSASSRSSTSQMIWRIIRGGKPFGRPMDSARCGSDGSESSPSSSTTSNSGCAITTLDPLRFGLP